MPLVKNVSVAKSVLKIASGLPSGPSQNWRPRLSIFLSLLSSPQLLLPGSRPYLLPLHLVQGLAWPACRALRFEHIRTTLVFHGPADLFFQAGINASSAPPSFSVSSGRRFCFSPISRLDDREERPNERQREISVGFCCCDRKESDDRRNQHWLPLKKTIERRQTTRWKDNGGARPRRTLSLIALVTSVNRLLIVITGGDGLLLLVLVTLVVEA